MPAQSNGDGRTARALWYVAPGQADLMTEALHAPREGEARLAMLWSGISRGTERLVFEGRVPASENRRMRAPMQAGDFPFPVKYGYGAVARVEDGPTDLAGRAVVCLHPHQERFNAPIAALTPVPDGVPPRRAVLAPNMETALNALWDSGASAGDRIVVVGGGTLGLLVAALAARLPGAAVTLIDVAPERRAIAEKLGLAFAMPEDAPTEADVVFHASASAAGLATALACAGMEARVVEMSWYGEGAVAAPLGGAFHSRRLTLAASQVGEVSPGRRVRWSHQRRLAMALDLLRDARLDALITDEIAFADLPSALPRLLAPGAPVLTTAVRYP